MIYYIALAFLLFVAYYLTRRFKKGKIIFLSIAFVLLSVIACFRDVSVGTDTLQYFNTYQNYAHYHLKDIRLGMVYEPGYMAYIITLSKISSNPRLLIILNYLFINFSILFFIYKNSKNYFISTIVYVLSCQFLASMCMMRQFLAISIVLLNFDAFLRGKNIRFIIAILIATMFHYFSLMFILLPIFKKIRKLSFTQLIIIVAVFIPIFIFLPNIILWVITHVDNYGDYYDYLDRIGELHGTLRFPPMMIILVVILFPFLFNFKDVFYKDEVVMFNGKDYSILNIIYFFLAFLIILAGRFSLFTRFYYYYTPFMVLIPNLYCKKENDNSWNLYYIAILSAAFVFCLATGSGTYGTEHYVFGF